MPDLWVDVDVGVIVPVNILPLLDDSDFKSVEPAVVYNSAGMDLVWNFMPCAGPAVATSVVPTTGGVYDWVEHISNKGMYSIEIPASGGASINNDTEGVGWFTGVATGILPWRGPTIGFRAAGLNNALIESAYSATRGLAGTALPAAAADAAGGLAISDAGGLDLDSKLANTNEVTVARMGALTDWINGGRLDLILDIIAADTTTDIPNLIAALNNLSAAQVNAEVDTALADIHLDHLIASADPGAVVANSSFLAKLVSKSATPAFSSYDNTTDSHEAIRDNMGTAQTGDSFARIGVAGAGLSNVPWNASWDAEVESEVDDALGGGTGTALTAIPWNSAWDAEVESEVDDALGGGTGTALTAIPWNASWDAEVQSEVTDALASGVTVTTNNDKTGYELSAGGVDAIHDEVVEGSTTHRQSMRLANAANAGKSNGAGTGTFNLRDIADTKNRIQATTDGTGNRSAVTVDVT